MLELARQHVRELVGVQWLLGPGGWAAFQISNDPAVHRPRTGLPRFALLVRAAAGRGPRGQSDRAWLGSAVELDDVRRAAAQGGMEVERTAGEGMQMCCVLARRAGGDSQETARRGSVGRCPALPS